MYNKIGILVYDYITYISYMYFVLDDQDDYYNPICHFRIYKSDFKQLEINFSKCDYVYILSHTRKFCKLKDESNYTWSYNIITESELQTYTLSLLTKRKKYKICQFIQLI